MRGGGLPVAASRCSLAPAAATLTAARPAGTCGEAPSQAASPATPAFDTPARSSSLLAGRSSESSVSVASITVAAVLAIPSLLWAKRLAAADLAPTSARVSVRTALATSSPSWPHPRLLLLLPMCWYRSPAAVTSTLSFAFFSSTASSSFAD